jgi:probable rRNA maturation factor
MPYAIDIENELEVPTLPEAEIRAAIAWVLTRENAHPDASVLAVFTNDDQVQMLNAKFREIDAPTDILSFPAEPLDDALRAEMLAEGEAEDLNHLGDLVIAYPYTERQAAREGHALRDALLLTVIHGTLHLLGHDHDTPDRLAQMWAVQAEGLRAFNINISVPTE